MNSSFSGGIDAFGFYIPKYYLPIELLALRRRIPAEKLTKGLGLKNMAVCHPDESIDFMAAEAIIDLCKNWSSDNGVEFDFNDIDKIYLGTESSIDSAKPTITYAIKRIQEKLNVNTSHIDFLDMTFACIGAVDAMMICLDYVRLNPTRKCIVVAADHAIYDLGTGGEYTQGAGAIALLIQSNPKLITIDSSNVGVSCTHSFDFYKPLRTYDKKEIFDTIAQAMNFPSSESNKVFNELQSANTKFEDGPLEGVVSSFWDLPETRISVHRKQPVFDGKLSNECFEERIGEALNRFLAKSSNQDFKHWIFHLPYAYQGRRIATKFWWNHVISLHPSVKESLIQQIPGELYSSEWWKNLSRCDEYKSFVNQCIAPTEIASSNIGNMYTASIFMALISSISNSSNNTPYDVLFLAYGSGSKSKVFSGRVNTPSLSLKSRLSNLLNSRQEVDFDTYEKWHKSNEY